MRADTLLRLRVHDVSQVSAACGLMSRRVDDAAAHSYGAVAGAVICRAADQCSIWRSAENLGQLRWLISTYGRVLGAGGGGRQAKLGTASGQADVLGLGKE